MEVVYTWPDGREEVRYRRPDGSEQAQQLERQVRMLERNLGAECPYSIRHTGNTRVESDK